MVCAMVAGSTCGSALYASAIRPRSLVVIQTHHNPIRVAKREERRQAEIEALGVSLTLTLAAVRAIAEALADGREPDRRLLPAPQGAAR
jgi:hypothetical protein